MAASSAPGRSRPRRPRCRDGPDRGCAGCRGSRGPPDPGGSPAGTRQSSSTSSEVSEERTPSLSSSPGAEAARCLAPTMKAEIPFLPWAAIRDRHDHGGVGDAAVGDEGLGSVEHPLPAVLHRGRLRAPRVRPGAVLGEAPAADRPRPWRAGSGTSSSGLRVPARKMWPEHRLLWAATDRATPASTRLSSSRTRHQSRVERPGAAVLRRPGHAHEAELGELAEHRSGELLLRVPLPRVRPKLRLGELADRLLEERLLLGKVEIHGEPPPARPEGPSVVDLRQALPAFQSAERSVAI